MKLLAFDTSTEACSVALDVDEQVSERFEVAPREHGRLLLPMIHALLAEAGLDLSNLDAIAFGRGPGAFTGVRVAVATAQGLALGAGVPLIPVSTLASLAQGTAERRGQRFVFAAIDARMGEVYAGAFECPESGYAVTALVDEQVCAPEAVNAPAGHAWYGAGSGWARYGEILSGRLGLRADAWDGQALPHARDMLITARAAYAEGRLCGPEQAQPVYLRQNIIQRPS